MRLTHESHLLISAISMTAVEQLALWGADPDNEIFISAAVGRNPAVTYRAKGNEALSGMRRISVSGKNVANLKMRNGITFVTTAGTMPVTPHLQYELLLLPSILFFRS